MNERLGTVGRIQDQGRVGAWLFESRHLTFEKFGSREVTGSFDKAGAQ
jgi:hypothetical protein